MRLLFLIDTKESSANERFRRTEIEFQARGNRNTNYMINSVEILYANIKNKKKNAGLQKFWRCVAQCFYIIQNISFEKLIYRTNTQDENEKKEFDGNCLKNVIYNSLNLRHYRKLVYTV